MSENVKKTQPFHATTRKHKFEKHTFKQTGEYDTYIRGLGGGRGGRGGKMGG
jgi:hypothetical protein